MDKHNKKDKQITDSELISNYESGKVNMESILKRTFEKPLCQSNFLIGVIK